MTPRPRPEPARQFVLLLLCHARLAVRGLPEGRAGWSRGLGSIVVAILVAIFVFAPSYRDLARALVHIVRMSGGASHLTPTLGGLCSALDAVLFVLGAGAFARIVHTPDMAILAPAPIPAHTIVAAQATRFAGSMSALFLVLGTPIVALIAAPLGLGAGWSATCVLIIATVGLLPLSAGLLLGVILLRAVPAAHARGTIALLAPTIGSLVALVSHLVAHLPSRTLQGVTGITAAVARAWDASPLTWDGHALGAVFARHAASAALYIGGDVLVAAVLALLGWALARDLFAAGWAAYAGQPGDRPGRPRHAGDDVAAPSLATLIASAPLPRPAAGAGLSWRILLGKEWRLARRDSIARGRVLTSILPLLVAVATALATAVSLSAHGAHALARLPRSAPHVQASVVGVTLYDVAILVSCGGLMVALVDAAWAREMPARDIQAHAPLSPATIVGALGVAYAAPVALLAALCVAGGALAIPLPVAAPLLSCAIITSDLAMLSYLSILVNAMWPARGRPAALVPQTLRARVALGVADLAAALWSGMFIAAALALLTLRHPALAVLCALIAVAVAAIVALLAVGATGRALDRLYTGS